MCGHVGVAGDLTYNAMKSFRQMLYMDALRGEHGTGVATVPFRGPRTPGTAEVMKMPVDAYTFLKNRAVDSLLSKQTHAVVIGHNRHATVGEHVQGNTHPFINESVMGAHNGTVSSHNRTFEVEGSYGTDSEAILASISENGIKKTFDGMTSCSQGAWALVWYDFKNDEINFVRNSHRPLVYAFNKDGDQLFWASEPFMLRAACSRNGVELDKIYAFSEDTRYRWAVPKTGEKFGEEVRTKCAGKKFVSTVPKTITSNTTGGRGFNPTKNPGTALSRLPSNFSTRLSHHKGYSNEDVVKLFKTSKNCCWCQTPVTAKQVEDDEAAVIAQDTVVCPSCSDVSIIKEALEERSKEDLKAAVH